MREICSFVRFCYMFINICISVELIVAVRLESIFYITDNLTCFEQIIALTKCELHIVQSSCRSLGICSSLCITKVAVFAVIGSILSNLRKSKTAQSKSWQFHDIHLSARSRNVFFRWRYQILGTRLRRSGNSVELLVVNYQCHCCTSVAALG